MGVVAVVVAITVSMIARSQGSVCLRQTVPTADYGGFSLDSPTRVTTCTPR
jgi:hypothetical protein